MSFGEEIGKVSFQIYEVGTLSNTIQMDEIFLNPKGSEIYYLQYYITWMIVTMMTFLEDYFEKIKEIRLNGKEISKEVETLIKFCDRDRGLSSILFFSDDFDVVKNGIKEFKEHVEMYRTIRDY